VKRIVQRFFARFTCSGFLLLWLRASLPLGAQEFLRVNQAGYLPHDTKIAVAFGSSTPAGTFTVCNAATGTAVRSGPATALPGASWGTFTRFTELNFSAFQSAQAVYHDDLNDYSSNEPTMDSTASAILMWALF
jgi:hypothetical protein